jgi:hypothetical protein
MRIGLYVNYLLFLSDLMKIEIFRYIFKKYSHIKFYENPSSGSRFVPYGQTDGQKDRHDEVNSRFSQFRESA